MRTTVVIPPELQLKAKRLAAERGVSFGHLVREALEEKVRVQRPPLRFLGIAESKRGDVSRRTAEEPVIPEPWR